MDTPGAVCPGAESDKPRLRLGVHIDIKEGTERENDEGTSFGQENV